MADNNNRPWFQENKGRYEREVLEPAMAFIRAFQPRLKRISPYFVASDRRVGGSLMRVYRDTRFAKDGEPYKTNVGIQFRHEQGRDIHAPGFYVHIAPGECFLAVGLWRPEPEPLGQIRQAIVEWPDRWRRARDDRKFRQRFALDGGSLKRPPRGFPADHPWIEDLKRTDFIGARRVGGAGRSRQGIPGPRGGVLHRQPSLHAFPVRCPEGAVLRANSRNGNAVVLMHHPEVGNGLDGRAVQGHDEGVVEQGPVLGIADVGVIVVAANDRSGHHPLEGQEPHFPVRHRRLRLA